MTNTLTRNEIDILLGCIQGQLNIDTIRGEMEDMTDAVYRINGCLYTRGQWREQLENHLTNIKKLIPELACSSR